jgi:dihydropteroate synthase
MFDTAPQLDCNGRLLRLDRPRVMGIVNVTPDSFSDGGAHFDAEAAVAQGLQLAEEGADILDIGGESTRPGAQAVPVEEELRRVIPVIERLARETALPISIDTSKPEVMRAAINAGAGMVNDVHGLRRERAGCRRRAGRARGADAHAGRAAFDAGGAGVRRRGGRGASLPRRAHLRRRDGGHRQEKHRD